MGVKEVGFRVWGSSIIGFRRDISSLVVYNSVLPEKFVGFNVSCGFLNVLHNL